MGYDCFQNDGNQAAMILTNLETGDTIGVCGSHVADWALSLLCAVTETVWVPETDAATDPETGDATDEPEAGDGPTVPEPAGEPAPVVEAPLPDDDGQDDDGDDGDQLAEDNAAYLAELRAELGAARG